MADSTGFAVPMINAMTGEVLDTVMLTGKETTGQLVERCGYNSHPYVKTSVLLDGHLCQDGQTLAEAGLCNRSSISMLKLDMRRCSLTASTDGTAKVWDGSGKCVLTLEGHDQPVNSASFSPDSRRIATGSRDDTVKIWSSSSGECLMTLCGDSDCFDYVTSTCFSPDSCRIVVGGMHDPPEVWSVETGERLLQFGGDLRYLRTLSVNFSPDWQRIVTGSAVQVQVWNANNCLEIFALDGPFGEECNASFSQDGARIVVGARCSDVKIFNALSGEHLLTLEGHKPNASVHSASFSPNGHRVGTAATDGTAKVWDATSGQCLLTLEGHQSSVESVCFSADGLFIITGSSDNTAKVWNAESGECTLTLEGHSGPVVSASFSPALEGHSGPVVSASFSPAWIEI